MYPANRNRAFIDGLLPEGHVRVLLADRARVAADDTFGLLRANGMGCAGAVQGGGVRGLTDTELADAVDDLPSAPWEPPWTQLSGQARVGFRARWLSLLAATESACRLTACPRATFSKLQRAPTPR
ncbi:hypothetical protein CVV67_01070 [Arthrobacter stackebrandtii]|nr:hypothetical protein CVV67_01070 [Arthrobacter stackebrandtii]